MNTTAIIVLVIGVAFLIASFFLPDKKKNRDTKKEEETRIKAIIDREVLNAKDRIEGMAEETVNYSVEKAERQLEKLSNEKIMAVDEYAETVLKRINDNHQEAVFLYDMLNDKGEMLKNSGAEIEQKSKELQEKEKEVEVQKEVVELQKEELQKEREALFVPFTIQQISEDEQKPQKEELTKEEPKEAVKPVAKKSTRTVKKPVTKESAPKRSSSGKADDEFEETKEVEIHFDKGNEGRKNSNEMIRKLHEEGKSNMAIAKELGLGVGEVKLVIDLFANKK